eukprot:7236294-Prymnesium_polylepis.1
MEIYTHHADSRHSWFGGCRSPSLNFSQPASRIRSHRTHTRTARMPTSTKRTLSPSGGLERQ